MLSRFAARHGLTGIRGCSRSHLRSCPEHVQAAEIQVLRRRRMLITTRRSFCTTGSQYAVSVRQRRKDIVPTADTIYALSTAAGRSAIAIIRISGPACLDIYGAICPDKSFPIPRIATLRKLRDPKDSTRVLDNGALVFYFPAPRTVTGDDVLELHVHGGPAIVRSILEAIPQCVDSRPRRRTAEFSLIRAAEPGEFTKRAFYNGRLDLTQAEALGETLAAETEQQRRLAVAGSNGGLAARYEKWRNTLLYARGELEALIDFSEDQHFDESPAEFMRSVSAQVYELKEQIGLHIQNASRGELLRSGISVALLGAPNAGKSSLLNHIAGREAAIVSTEAGTTRDIVDVQVDIGGWLVKLGDMAGLRGDPLHDPHSEVGPMTNSYSPMIGQVEREGIRRAKERALQSDLVIVLISLLRTGDEAIDLSINSEIVDAVEQCRKVGKRMVFVVNKIDLLPSEGQIELVSGLRQRILNVFPYVEEGDIFLLSCKDAASSSMPTPEVSLPKLSDPGGVQTFLLGLSQVFTTMTSAATGMDSLHMSTTQTLSPSEARSYWSASLAVTHRQSTYLQSCAAHLDDFLARSTLPRVDVGTRSSHHVDGHDDLVGERVRVRERLPENADDEFDVIAAAEHLRYAADCLAKITGRGDGGDVEDVLGVVFEK